VSLEGGKTFVVHLEEGDESMFGPRFDPDMVSIPASCFFGLMQVRFCR
jgi:hypothetical protein